MPEERAARVQWPWHEWNRFHSMFHNLRPGDVLFDIGAEQGDQSALYQRWIQRPATRNTPISAPTREGGIVLVEPNPIAWANIKVVWEANDLREPLGFSTEFITNRHVPAGVTNLPLTDWPRSARFPINTYVGTVVLVDGARQTTIDTMAGDFPSPDALTIDIEGGELDALRGAMGVLTLDKPLVWVSIHWQELLMRGQSRQELIDYMGSLGYEHEHLGQDHEIHALFWHPEGRIPVLPYAGVVGS